jgi:hypothetical protein
MVAILGMTMRPYDTSDNIKERMDPMDMENAGTQQQGEEQLPCHL